MPFEVLYEANLSEERLRAAAFSGRLADAGRAHYRMVKCSGCGLVRSNPVIEDARLRELYTHSGFGYADELSNLKQTYGRCLEHVLDQLPDRGALLDVGCGNGFFLERALQLGFRQVRGVEPSAEAVALARPDVRANIVTRMFEPGMFPPESFDVISFFMLLDHISEPGKFLRACREMLKPGGFLICVTHDVRSLMVRLLGRRCPVIHIQHTCLYDRTTIAKLMRRSGLSQVDVRGLANGYSLDYWLKLFPAPGWLTRSLLNVTGLLGLRNRTLTLRAGNMVAYARKPFANSLREAA